MVSSYIYILIYIASSPSFLLRLEKYLFLSPRFSAQTSIFLRPNCDHMHLTKHIPTVSPSSPCSSHTQPAKPDQSPSPYSPAPAGLLQPCSVSLQSLPFLLLLFILMGFLQQHCHSWGKDVASSWGLQRKMFSVSLFSAALWVKLNSAKPSWGCGPKAAQAVHAQTPCETQCHLDTQLLLP